MCPWSGPGSDFNGRGWFKFTPSSVLRFGGAFRHWPPTPEPPTLPAAKTFRMKHAAAEEEEEAEALFQETH